MLLLTSMMQLVMTVASHLLDVWSWVVFRVTVVMSVHEAAFRPATSEHVLACSLHPNHATGAITESCTRHSELNVFCDDTVQSART
jgi:hypothetical protein